MIYVSVKVKRMLPVKRDIINSLFLTRILCMLGPFLQWATRRSMHKANNKGEEGTCA